MHLRTPACYVASFNRPNLTYRVIPKSQAAKQVIDYARRRSHESGIVYCASRAGADSVAAKLAGHGVPAASYHAGLDKAERSRTQERFLRDEVRVVCATIAFGMGINKPNVRFVIHHDLPKNLESYYQETGRAGRDGLPAECLLLFSPGDVAKQLVFIEEKPDAHEQQIARQQLQQMVHYAEQSHCRRAALLAYFGETWTSDGCGACDNCLSPRATYDGTLAAQKLLSCVYRIRERSHCDFGLNHVVAVLTGGDTDRIRHLGHQQLSTYGIGTEHGRNEWAGIARELIRLGFLRQEPGKYPTVGLTAEGLAALKERRRISLTRPLEAPRARPSRPGEIACDETLFETLRQLRRRLAEAEGVPPYIVFGDVTLRLMAREYPVTAADLRLISGVGEVKLHAYGDAFADAIRNHLRDHPRQSFAAE